MATNGRFSLISWILSRPGACQTDAHPARSMSHGFTAHFRVLGVVALVASLMLGFALDSSHAKEVFRGEEGVKPYSHLRFQNNPDNFQFAIVSDRMGGHRPGVFSAAIDLLNLLQPEFVMSVGDYIEGYVEDEAQLKSDWKEVDDIVNRLDMPFFFIVGNHDNNYDVTRKLWMKRFGGNRDYYHFIYKDVLFLLLCTEDPPTAPDSEAFEQYKVYKKLMKENPKKAAAWVAVHGDKLQTPTNISDAQVEYFKKVLAANPKVRWTFVFLHKPVWDEDHANFKKIESFLANRPYTMFAGHKHNYKYSHRNGRDYIRLGATGGVWVYKGIGNMDHVTWVTMTDKGPIIGNLVLNGILDKRGAAPTLDGFLAYRPRQISMTGQSLGIKSVPNLRDLGGYKTSDGRTVFAGLVYRSNQLSGIKKDDMKTLANLKLKSAYDLRTEEERKKRPGELPREVNYVWLDVLADSPQAGPAQLEKLMKDPKAANKELGGGKVEEGFKKSYREFVSLPSAKLEFRKLFISLGDKNQLPALFHCTTGKDRTGWAAAALLTLLGVPKDKVMEDYLRSNDYILPAYKKTIDAFVAAGGDKAIPPAILGVKKEYLDAAFDEMQKKYGTIEKYFSEGLGIDANKQKALRDLYLGQGSQKQQTQGDSKEPKKKAVAK